MLARTGHNLSSIFPKMKSTYFALNEFKLRKINFDGLNWKALNREKWIMLVNLLIIRNLATVSEGKQIPQDCERPI